MTSLPSYCHDRDSVLKEQLDGIKWRHDVPNYSKVNDLFEKLKITDHRPGTLEFIVQNLVKNWEKEASHKTDPRQWFTINADQYRFSCNGLEKYTAWQMVEQGTYNALIGQTQYYDSQQISFDESHDIFKSCLSEGFAWEVIEVYSPPPTVTFKWRHFGKMTHPFCCRALSGHKYKADATNKIVELFGMCKATVNDKCQIEDLQIFFDPNNLFAQLTEISPFAPFECFADIRTKPKLPEPKPKEISIKEHSSVTRSKFCVLS